MRRKNLVLSQSGNLCAYHFFCVRFARGSRCLLVVGGEVRGS